MVQTSSSSSSSTTAARLLPITGFVPQAPQFQFHNSLHPNIYIAPYHNSQHNNNIEINADINKAAWAQIPWSSNFDDIRGPNDAPSPEDRPSANCQTQFKMQWDEEYLYILALLHSDMEVPATYTTRNSPIYHQDSDFEVFVDPLGTCHSYKELEMNALNTVWNLMLDKPYEDGGVEHSGRIAKFGEDDYYEVERQTTAAKVLKGKVNGGGGGGEVVWAVEIALAHTDTLKHQIQQQIRATTTAAGEGGDNNHNEEDRVVDDDSSITPKVGDRWRLNFSRVEKKGDINWTWQPQRIWDPILKKHVGKVNMHLPDAWGYVQFGPAVDKCNTDDDDDCRMGQVPLEEIVMEGKGDPLWPVRVTVLNVYYAQRRYREAEGVFASDLNSLIEYTDANIIAPFVDACEMVRTTSGEDDDTEDGYIFKIHFGGSVVSVTNTRLVNVEEDSIITDISEQVSS